MNKIATFSGTYAFLSNFYSCRIFYEGITYPTSEHAFQAAKILDLDIRLHISKQKTPALAKKYGRKVELRPDWEDKKVQVMTDIVRIKFSKDPLKTLLIETDDIPLEEGNWWGDMFWGVGYGEGENHLGKILMKIRRELKEDAK